MGNSFSDSLNIKSKSKSVPRMDEPDATTGLTPRQVNAVQESWVIVKKDIKKHAVDLFLAFFDAHPDYQSKFKAFASVPREELPGNKKLLAHANSVMYALTSLVDNLDDSECIVEMLKKIGTNHGQRAITEVEFKNLKIVLLKYLKVNLGNNLSPYAEEAWAKTLDVANSVIFTTLTN